MRHNLWLEFEHRRNGELIKAYEEEAHSWTLEAWLYMIRFFMLHGPERMNGFSAAANNNDRGIVVGGSDKPFDIMDTALDQQHRMPADQTQAHQWIVQPFASENVAPAYDGPTKTWTLRLRRKFNVISAHLGGYAVTIKEVGLYSPEGLAWARDVLETPITLAPLDELTITYRININMAAID